MPRRWRTSDTTRKSPRGTSTAHWSNGLTRSAAEPLSPARKKYRTRLFCHPLHQQEEQERNKKQTRSMGEIGGSVEQEIRRRECAQGGKQSHLGSVELLADGIEEQERAGAQQRVDEPWHAKPHADGQEARPSWRIFAVVSTIIHNMDMVKELSMSRRRDGESPLAENLCLNQIRPLIRRRD